jgi:capsular exopolysaccharide synthesis family protein
MQQEREVHLRDYWRVLSKRRWTVIATFIILVTTVMVATFSMEPVYRATTQLLIERDNPNIVSIQEVMAVDATSTDYYQTQYEILRSENLSRRVIHRLDLNRHPEFGVEKSEASAPEVERPEIRERRILGNFQKALKINPIRNSRLVNLSFESRDPQLAARAVNTLADEYIRYSIETKINASQEARSWLQTQVDEMQEKVKAAEQAFEDFKQTIPQQIMTQVESGRATREMENRPEVVNNVFIQELRSEEIKLSAKLAELSKKYGPRHPQMIQLGSELSTLQGKMDREIKRVVAAVMVEQSPQYLLLKREAETNRKLYETLLTRLKETTVTENLPQSNIHIVDRGQVPEHPVKPRKRMNFLLSVMLALATGVSFAFFLEYLDNTLRSPEEIERFLEIPFLGTVPAAREGRNGSSIDLIVETAPKSAHAEAYRTIRTGILLSMAEHQPRVILVTSPAPLEGKTTTAANLAVAMAQAGNSVLLVDGDLRKSQLHLLFGLDDSKGLSSLLIGAASLEYVVQKTSVPLLSVLPAGSHPPNPVELLGSSKMREVVVAALRQFDRVIIDSPPLIPVADSMQLAMACDGVVLVLRESQTTRDQAMIGQKRLTDCNAKILGAILNAVDLTRSYYYYPYYGHSYTETEKVRGA